MAWGQGTWDAPAIPGSDISTTNTGNYAIYNIKADAFIAEGMNYGTQALACRLENGYSSGLANRQKFTLSVSAGKVKMIHANHTNRGVGCAGTDANNIYADYASNNEWTYSASANFSNAYTLNITGYGTLDVDDKWGGKLTIKDGMGFTDWAFIPEGSLTDGSFAKWVERKAMYDVYQALVASGTVTTYASDLTTANAVYTNATASVEDLRAATRALILATAPGIESKTNVSALFTNADMQQYGTADWSSTGVTRSAGAIEEFHAAITLAQEKTDMPNGLYTVYFRGMSRQDGSDAAPVFKLISGTNEKTANIPFMTDIASVWNVRSGDKAANWSGSDGTKIPDRLWRAAEGLAYEAASASIGDFKVTGNTLNISVTQSSTSQWFAFNSFDIYYSGSANIAIYNNLQEVISTATSLVSSPMKASVKTELNTAITDASALTKLSEEDDLNNALSALNTAITNANTSITIYTAINDYLTFSKAKVDGDYTAVTTNISNGTYSTLAEATSDIKGIRNGIVYAAAADKENITQLIDNPGFESGNTNYWTVGSSDDTGARSTSNATYVMENSEGNYLFNTWSKGIPLTQSLGELPAGTYTLISTVASDGGTIYLLVNEDHSTSIATTDASKGLTLNKTFTLDAPTEVTIGVVGSAGDLSYTAEGHWWYKADNFRLIKGELILPTSIALNTPSVDLITGSKVTLTATVAPDNTTDKSVSWSSSDNTVATVSDGVVIAQGAGTATITAKSSILGSVSATATVTVTDAAAPAHYSELAEGDFYIRNVATGKFLDGGNDYGTRASISKRGVPMGLKKVSDGVYTIDSYMFRDANNHFLRGDYCDQGATNIYITDLGGGKYALSTEAANKYITVNAGATIVANTAANSTSSLAQWQFVSLDDLKAGIGTPTTENPADLTFYIRDANNSKYYSLSNGNLAWVGDYARGGIGSVDPFTAAERYHNTTNVYQTVAVPNGNYKVRVQGFYRADAGSAHASYFYANGEETALQVFNGNGQGTVASMDGAVQAFSKDQYWNELNVTVSDNKLTLGIKTDDANNWTLWDNFELWLKDASGLNVTPAIADGDYYLAAGGKLITRRGGDSGEKNQAMAAETGLEVTVSTDFAGISTITFKDTDLRLFWNNEKVYTDGTMHILKNYHHPYWAIEENGNFFKIRNIETGKYLTTATVSEELIANCAAESADWLFAKNVSINETADYAPTALAANVTLTRTLSNTNWNTFVVPFDIDNATLTAKFGTVEVAEYAEASADAQNATVSFTKMATPAITANTPVLLKTSTAPASVTFNGVQVKTGEAKVAGTNFDFVGSYDASKFVKTGDYYIYQNKIYKSAKDDGTFIKGTRAYIEAKTTGARIVDFTIDGVTSGIRDLNADLSECEDVVYNLNGQKVQNMKNGVFVKNGKKVVVK